ncbi:MAG: type IV pilin protein [Longimicrobiales bacterium]
MKRSKGFTLIELMITVAVVAILAAVAYPAFLDQTRKSRRAEAQALLMNVATRQQQQLLDTRAYANSVAALNVTPPASVVQHYGITVSVGTATVPSFTATAAPTGGQAEDKCGTLSVNQLGAKSPANCW